MKLKIVIPGRFDSLNELIDQSKRGRGKYNNGNAMKQRDQQIILFHLPRAKFKRIFLEYHYYEPNAMRDKDNIAGYFHKIFQDALVQKGIIKNDGWKEIEGWSDSFSIDKKNPRIEIYISEV